MAATTQSPYQRKWFPHPALSVAMWLMWLLMTNSLSGGHVVLGAFLGWMIPFLTQAFWPEAMVSRKPILALKFFLLVVSDIVIANIQVAILIMGPSKRLQPAFMSIPLDVRQDFTITLLANTISLTPGTVSADLSVDRRTLTVHALNVQDVDAAVAQIKQRYEAPLKEIFE